MALGQKSNQVLVPQARQGLERLKFEIANEIATGNDPQAQTLQYWYQSGYGGEVPSRVWGAVGGNMVRRMIAAAEQSLIQQAATQVQAGFRQAAFGGSQQGQNQAQQQVLQSQPLAQGTPNPQQLNVPTAQ